MTRHDLIGFALCCVFGAMLAVCVYTVFSYH